MSRGRIDNMRNLFSIAFLAFLSACATNSTSKPSETRAPSSQICRAECVIQDAGQIASINRALAARLEPVSAPDFLSLKKICEAQASRYIQANREELSREYLTFQDSPLEFFLDARLYTRLQLRDEKGSRTYIDMRSPEANAANSCQSN